MLHYIKTVTGIKYEPMCKDDMAMKTLKVYALPFQKYKEWHFFGIVFFVYYRAKIAKERLWKHTYHDMPYYGQIYTDEQLKKYYNLVVKEDGSLWCLSEVVVTLSDGTKETVYFESNEEAEHNIAKLIKEYGLKQYFSLNEWKYNND